jgi:hypothetical protein
MTCSTYIITFVRQMQTMYSECYSDMYYTVYSIAPAVHHVIHVEKCYHHQACLTNVCRKLVCLYTIHMQYNHKAKPNKHNMVIASEYATVQRCTQVQHTCTVTVQMKATSNCLCILKQARCISGQSVVVVTTCTLRRTLCTFERSDVNGACITTHYKASHNCRHV